MKNNLAWQKIGNVYYMAGIVDAEKKHFALLEDLFWANLLFGVATYEQVKAIYDKHEMEIPEQSCKLGKYVYTNKGLMFTLHGLYYELNEYREAVESSYEGYVEILRPVSSFDF